MATILDVVEGGGIEPYDCDLGIRQQKLRSLYFRPQAWAWIEQNLPGVECEFGGEITPIEQLDDLLTAFCAGDPLEFDRQINVLHSHGSGIWELKTLALRLFGWFGPRDCFICTRIDFATRVKQHRLYSGYRDEAIGFCSSFDLTQLCIYEADPDAVITNARYP